MIYSAVGKPLGHVEGPAKVSGQATCTVDILLPGMIWGKALRSPLPHGRIVRLDSSAATGMPGVLAVLTAEDIPDLLIGRRVCDMPVLAHDCVRFIGEKVAVVAAEAPDVAEEALGPLPFQSKSIGENSITPITGAIANALHDAVGLRITDLPITAEKIVHALHARQGA
jgi:CO/xanthine dehydrogenase Mo-binding subunit